MMFTITTLLQVFTLTQGELQSATNKPGDLLFSGAHLHKRPRPCCLETCQEKAADRVVTTVVNLHMSQMRQGLLLKDRPAESLPIIQAVLGAAPSSFETEGCRWKTTHTHIHTHIHTTTQTYT